MFRDRTLHTKRARDGKWTQEYGPDETTTEPRFIDRTKTGAVPTTTDMSAIHFDPAQWCLNGVNVGSGAEDRAVQRYKITSVEVKWRAAWEEVSQASLGVPEPGQLFIAIILDTQNQIGVTNGYRTQDVFTNPLGTNKSSVLPFRNLYYGDRFRVLKKWLVTREYTAGAAFNIIDVDTLVYPPAVKSGSAFIPLDIVVNCSGSSNTTVSILDNALHIVACCDDGLVELSYHSRVKFQLAF